MEVVAIRDINLGGGYWVYRGTMGVVINDEGRIKKVRWASGPVCDATVGADIAEEE